VDQGWPPALVYGETQVDLGKAGGHKDSGKPLFGSPVLGRLLVFGDYVSF